MSVLSIIWLVVKLWAYLAAMVAVVLLGAVAIVAPPIAAWKVVRR